MHTCTCVCLTVVITVVITVLVDDDNCITLKPLPEAEDYQEDYINACYVDVRYAVC